MGELISFLYRNSTPEKEEFIKELYLLLQEAGIEDYVIEIDNILMQEGYKENFVIETMVEHELADRAYRLLLNFFIIVRQDHNLSYYTRLIKFLNNLENSLNSKEVISLVNEELTAREQFDVWLQTYLPEYYIDLSDFIFDVRPTFVENLIQLHEGRIDIEPMGYDEELNCRVTTIKRVLNTIYPNTSSDELRERISSLDLIKSYGFTKLMDKQTFYINHLNKINNDIKDSTLVCVDIILYALMMDDETHDIKLTIDEIINKKWLDTRQIMEINKTMKSILDKVGDLCKNQNIS